MKIAVEGCMHGELNKMYETITEIENREGYKIDLLLCCGDFQSTRNFSDLRCMAVPDKYKEMGSFYQYYSGEKVAPVLTIFVGGNHEASNYLQELPYGGWVAPNIYYLGYAGVVEFNGFRIAGMSGIYKGIDYLKGHYESPPYDQSSMRSVYHIRNIDVFRLRQLSNSKPDVVLSHDWPRGIHNHGDVEALLRRKQFFRQDIEADRLGSRPAMEVLETLKPNYWFAAHLHCKFAAVVEHDDESVTKFLALDKCLPNRRFLQVLTVGDNDSSAKNAKLRFDPEWLAILRSTNHLLSVERKDVHMPGPRYAGRWDFKPSQDEVEEIIQILGGNLEIPNNFEATQEVYNPNIHHKKMLWRTPDPSPKTNPQTEWLCSKLEIDDPLDLLVSKRYDDRNVLKLSDFTSSPQEDVTRNLNETTAVSFNQDEIVLDDEDDDEEDNNDCNKVDQTTATVAIENITRRSFLNLPSPKRPHQTTDKQEETEVETKVRILDEGDSFAIDKTGGADLAPALEEIAPVKKVLKRRNQAVYVEDE